MKFENTKVFNFEGAFRGLRNPLESWGKSDSTWTDDNLFSIGQNDLTLARRMIAADDSDASGAPNSKFLRQIMVSVDITAPLYLWKQFDTYKVGTVANSTSTMHKIHSSAITLDDFELDDFVAIDYPLDAQREDAKGVIDTSFVQICLIPYLEFLRQKYLETKDKIYWKELIRWLPEGWLQKRTVTLNYAVLRDIYHWRKNHKLTEWHSFCKWIESLPYADDLITFNN